MNGTKRKTGFTLIEVVAVTLVIGLIAAVVLPNGNNNVEARVDAAAADVAAAVRFARDESIRTGEPYGVRQQNSANRFRVFRIDGGGTLIFDVYHPTSKQLWDFQFDDAPAYPGVDIARSMSWRGGCNKDGNIAFRGDGTPFCTDPVTVLLDQGTFEIELDDVDRDINVDGFTGRVWVE